MRHACNLADNANKHLIVITCYLFKQACIIP